MVTRLPSNFTNAYRDLKHVEEKRRSKVAGTPVHLQPKPLLGQADSQMLWEMWHPFHEMPESNQVKVWISIQKVIVQWCMHVINY